MLRQSPLLGFKTPSMPERIVVTMFADDTTVYLTMGDDIQILTVILDNWCAASGAKFNIEKTEFVPIGPEPYRLQLIQTRKLCINAAELPAYINIAGEGEAKHFLGAWIGNGTNQEGIWSTTVEKIQSRLLQWEKTMPTIEGRRIIIQWIIGGMTQYLTNVQGMPKAICKTINSICNKFKWDNEGRATINAPTMSNNIETGGKCILNITDRNDAIVLGWVRDYLKPAPDKPTWAYFMDNILSKIARPTPVVPFPLRTNVFLQSWTVTQKSLPLNIKKMLQTAKKYGVCINPLELSEEQAGSMPVWFH
ncbi:hypothetical protein BDN70DRAFT_818558, partial [Pholiota conissans]